MVALRCCHLPLYLVLHLQLSDEQMQRMMEEEEQATAQEAAAREEPVGDAEVVAAVANTTSKLQVRCCS